MDKLESDMHVEPDRHDLDTSANSVKKMEEIPAVLKKEITNTHAIQELIHSVLLMIQKAHADHEISAPFLDHLTSAIGNIQQMITNVPMTLMSLDDTLKALEQLPQKCTYETLGKNAVLISALFAKTIGLLQFIDKQGGSTIASLIQLDEQYLGGIAARVGSSCLFTSTLGGFKDELTFFSSFFAIVNATLAHKKNINTEMATSRPDIQASFEAVYFLTVASETCKIVTMFCAASTTWPVLCFGVVRAVLKISKELYKAELDQQQKDYNKSQGAAPVQSQPVEGNDVDSHDKHDVTMHLPSEPE